MHFFLPISSFSTFQKIHNTSDIFVLFLSFIKGRTNSLQSYIFTLYPFVYTNFIWILCHICFYNKRHVSSYLCHCSVPPIPHQCRLNAWERWPVARRPYVCCVWHVFMLKHGFSWKYQYNKYTKKKRISCFMYFNTCTLNPNFSVTIIDID